MKRNNQRRLLPRDLSVVAPEDEALIAGRQVIRLLRKYPHFPVYRRIRITRGLVSHICYILDTTLSIRVLLNRIADTIPESFLKEMAPSSPDPTTTALIVNKLTSEQPDGMDVLDERFVADVLDLLRWAQFRKFSVGFLQGEPTRAQDYHHRGHAFCILGEHERAVEEYSTAIRMDPRRPHFYRSRAQCLFNDMKDPAGALIDIRATISRHSEHPIPRVLSDFLVKARLLIELEEFPKALESLGHYAKSIEAVVSSATWNEKGAGTLGDSWFDGFAVRHELEEGLVHLQRLRKLGLAVDDILSRLVNLYSRF